MANIIDYAREGSRIFLSSIRTRIAPKQYQGSAESICQEIVNDCWNRRFYQTSTTNFPQFWTRDFAWCVRSLVQLGYKDKVHQTLRYAIKRFIKARKITTTISPRGKPFDFPYPAADSLPYLIRSIKVSGFPYQQYKTFLNIEIKKYKEYFLDEKGLVKKDLKVSSIKDFAVRKSSCYDNCCVAMLANDLKGMKLKNPFDKDYQGLLIHNFWNGDFFYDDLNKRNYVAADANIFPFALGVIKKEEMLTKALQSIHQEGLDKPLPLRYTKKDATVSFIPEQVFLRKYELDTIWTHMGIIYIKLLKEHKPSSAKEYQQAYRNMIEEFHGYPEVLVEEKGQLKLYHTPFYKADPTMLWAANYLTLP